MLLPIGSRLGRVASKRHSRWIAGHSWHPPCLNMLLSCWLKRRQLSVSWVFWCSSFGGCCIMCHSSCAWSGFSGNHRLCIACQRVMLVAQRFFLCVCVLTVQLHCLILPCFLGCLLWFYHSLYDDSITRCCEGNSAGVNCFLMRASLLVYVSVCTWFNFQAMSGSVRVLRCFMPVRIASSSVCAVSHSNFCFDHVRPVCLIGLRLRESCLLCWHRLLASIMRGFVFSCRSRCLIICTFAKP